MRGGQSNRGAALPFWVGPCLGLRNPGVSGASCPASCDKRRPLRCESWPAGWPKDEPSTSGRFTSTILDSRSGPDEHGMTRNRFIRGNTASDSNLKMVRHTASGHWSVSTYTAALAGTVNLRTWSRVLAVRESGAFGGSFVAIRLRTTCGVALRLLLSKFSRHCSSKRCG